MLLSAETFEALIADLYPARATLPTQTDAGGQRRSPRVPITTRLTLIPFATGAENLAGFDFPLDSDGSLQIPLADPVSVPIRDLSRGGLRFMMPRRLPLDTPFVLLLATPAKPMVSTTASVALPLAIECTVTYWQPVQRDLFAIGAQFVRELTPFAIPSQPPTIVLPGFGAIADLPIRAAV